MKEEKQKKLFLIGMSVLLILILLFGGTYAWLTLQLKGTKVNVLKAGNLALILDDENSIGIHQEKAVPTLDKVGETLDPYHFTLENLSDLPTGYTIYLDDLDLEEGEERLLDEYLRYSLTKDGTSRTDDLTSTGENPNRVLDSGTIAGGQTITYDLRLWINISTGNEAMNKVFRSKIRVVAIQKEEKDCYVFNKETKEITDYLCSIGNENGMLESSIVTIPEEIDGVTVERIGERAFSNKKLTSVTIPDTVTTISDYAFLNNEISSLVMPSHLVSVGKAAFNNNKLSDSEAFIYKRNSDGSMDTTTVVSYGGSKRTNVIIPSGVTTIGMESFGNNQLVSVILPEGVTAIGTHAFANNNLTSVTIPSTVTSIGASSFLKSSSNNSNIYLNTIINKTGKSFNFGSATGGTGTFSSGTVTHTLGNIVVKTNSNMVAIYQYNASSCLTGEESTCVEIGPQETYTAGTIIKYKVNASTQKYFHVISDNEEEGTLTMQQRENTIYATPWYETASDHSKGPLTVLPALEKATAGWTNVKDQTYTMGVTPFQGNKFTGCGSTECTTNKYTLPSRTGKARMITVQEAHGLGCTMSIKSCPNWMVNYLYHSTSYGGTVNQTGGEYGNNYGYWTMSAYSSDVTSAMDVHCDGNVYDVVTTRTHYGARAVVVIDK